MATSGQGKNPPAITPYKYTAKILRYKTQLCSRLQFR